MPKGCGNRLGKLWGCRFHYICLSFLCPLHLFFSIFHAGLLWVILLGLGVHTAFSYLFIQAVFFSLTCISSFFLCCGNLFCWVPFSLYPLFSQFSILPPVSGYGDCHAFSSRVRPSLLHPTKISYLILSLWNLHVPKLVFCIIHSLQWYSAYPFSLLIVAGLLFGSLLLVS